MPDWSIKIVPADNPTPQAPAAFVPDLIGKKAGNPLSAQVDDLVTWNNTTNDAHWPWPADQNGNPLPDAQVSTANGNYLSDQIPALRSSRPSYDVKLPSTASATVPPTGTLSYCCKLHPQERGTIDVTGIPPTPKPPTS
jgi:plastocyanin